MKSLDLLFGVSANDAARLEEAAVRSVADLAAVQNLEELGTRAGISPSLLREWQRAAQAEVRAAQFRRRIAAILTALMLVLASWVTYRLVPSKSSATYLRASALYKERKYAEAGRVLDDAFALRQNTAELHNLRGMIYRRIHKTPDAITEFQKAVELDPSYDEAWNNLGNAHQRKEPERAIQEYQKAVALKPQLALYHRNLGHLWELRGNVAGAEAEYKAAIQVQPSEIASYLDLSNLYQSLKRPGEAEAVLVQATTQNPTEIASYTDLSDLYRREKRPDQAESVLVRATTRNPGSDTAFAALASFYFDSRRYAEGSRAYYRADELNPDAGHLEEAAMTLRDAQQWDEALRAYQKILEKKPNDWDAHFQSGWILVNKGGPFAQQAIRQLQAAIAATPGEDQNKWCYLNLAIGYSNLGQIARADEALTEALRLDASFAPALIQRALMLQNAGQYQVAEKLYREAIHAEPSNTLAYYDLWWLYRNLHRADQVQKVFRKVQTIAPNDLYAQLMLARVRQDKEDFTGAAETYSKVHERDPEEPYYLALLATAEILAGMKKQDKSLVQKGMSRLEQAAINSPAYDTCFALAWAYLSVPERRDPDKAGQLYQKALNYVPNDLSALQGLAVVKLLKGDFLGAISESGKALKLNPRDPGTLENLAYGQFLEGNVQKAIESYERALEITKDDPVLRAYYGEALFWSGNTLRAQEEFAQARDALSRPSLYEDIWIGFIDPRYDATEKRHAAYYSTIAEKQALVELFDALAYLQESNVASALEKYQDAAKLLSASSEDDKEIVRKAINDLHRLQKELPSQPTSELGLGYLYDWLGDHERAVLRWKRYLELGTDPVGMEEAHRRLTRGVSQFGFQRPRRMSLLSASFLFQSGDFFSLRHISGE
ncbi:MAG TPA: tetratricopeptide repeat protein [Candidatus Acidoferrum sp.]|nr:tetratricopeptide repeat protein [Candidatus Acidoferrum sp.]